MPDSLATRSESLPHVPEDGSSRPEKFPPRLVGPVRATGEVVEDLERRDARWEDWVAVAPVVPEVEGQVERNRFERTIEQKLGHLAEVCHRPRAQLRLETERVPVALARRISPKASAWLAGHPEDWNGRTLSSVIPRNILARLPEDDLDIYENRLATRLVDHLRRYLARRIQALTDLKRLANQARDLQGAMVGSSWGTRWRASFLLGDLFERSAVTEQLTRTLDALLFLDSSLRQLQATRVYRVVPRRQLPATIRMTNILANDQHYRQVASLWRSWVRHGRLKPSRKKDEETWEHFQRFAVLVVVRALEMFNLSPEDEAKESPMRPGTRVALVGSLGRFSFTRREDGWILLEAHDISPRLWLGTRPGLEPPGDVTPKDILALFFPKVPRDRSSGEDRLPEKENEAPGKPGAEGLAAENLLISPLDLGSVERVMRTIQRWFLEPRFLAYPPRVDIPAWVPDDVLEPFRRARWLAVEERAAGNDRSDHRHHRLGNGKRGRKRNPKQVVPGNGLTGKPGRRFVVRNAPINPQDTGQVLAKAQRVVKREHRDHLKDLTRLIDGWKAAFDDAFGRLELLRVCPVCQTQVQPREFSPRADGAFACTCSSCNARWEVQICGACGERFGVIARHGVSAQELEVEDALGLPNKDVLAEPRTDGEGWVCPRCGG